MLKNLILILSLLIYPAITLAQASLGELTFKTVSAQQILVVEYNGDGHIAPYFGKLVAYYNKEQLPFEVVFPQMTIEFSQQKQWIAIAYTGNAKETEEVKIKSLPKLKVASLTHTGSYQSLSKTIPKLYQELYKQKKFPSSTQALRLLYLNSPDDHHSKDLITEIQIPLEP